MADVVSLRPRAASTPAVLTGEAIPAVFDDAIGPGLLAARWLGDATVELTVCDGRGPGPLEFRLAADDVLDLVRVLVEGLNEPGPIRLGATAPVLPLTRRRDVEN